MRTIDIQRSRLTGSIVVTLVLSLSYGLDNFLITYRSQAIPTFNMRSFVYPSGKLLILFAMLITFLAWFLSVYPKSSWLKSIFFLVIGLVSLIREAR